MTDRLVQACRQFEASLLKQSLLEAGFGRRLQIESDSNGDDADKAAAIFASDDTNADILQSLYADAMAQAIANADPSGFSTSLATQLERAHS
ncbi:MAG TPA: hypothetical protein VKT51_12060 [Candidatus Eremiobacteraceae bacterium]|nr:hypothetical protein [Candidatus Eremiobacteraceae bacterium]